MLHMATINFVVRAGVALLAVQATVDQDSISGDVGENIYGRQLQIPVVQRPKVSCPPRTKPGVPTSAVQYNGIAWPDYCFEGEEEEHFYLMGDYGGIAEPTPGPTNCDVEVANNVGNTNNQWPRNYINGIDDKANILVAGQMLSRAAVSKPRFVLNAGDNFYWGGVDMICGTPMDTIKNQTYFQFSEVFENMYRGPGMDDVPWFTTFGNHDFGGYQFNMAWDQQIAYTWATGGNATGRWTIPAIYWKTTVNYPTKGFSVEIFMVDGNINDVYTYGSNPGHNICGTHNPSDAGCGVPNGGPWDTWDCPSWFQNLWDTQWQWLEDGLNASTADWQIIVTHYPPDEYEMPAHRVEAWSWLSNAMGIDFMVTSHRHDQEIWMNAIGGTTYVVCGGGGGITSEHDPKFDPSGAQDGAVTSEYGFMDVTINKTNLRIEAIDEWGHVTRTENVVPRSIPNQVYGQLSSTETGCQSRRLQDTADSPPFIGMRQSKWWPGPKQFEDYPGSQAAVKEMIAVAAKTDLSRVKAYTSEQRSSSGAGRRLAGDCSDARLLTTRYSVLVDNASHKKDIFENLKQMSPSLLEAEFNRRLLSHNVNRSVSVSDHFVSDYFFSSGQAVLGSGNASASSWPWWAWVLIAAVAIGSIASLVCFSLQAKKNTPKKKKRAVQPKTESAPAPPAPAAESAVNPTVVTLPAYSQSAPLTYAAGAAMRYVTPAVATTPYTAPLAAPRVYTAPAAMPTVPTAPAPTYVSSAVVMTPTNVAQAVHVVPKYPAY